MRYARKVKQNPELSVLYGCDEVEQSDKKQVTLGAVVLSSLLLFAAAFTFRRRALDRWEGVLFLAIYGAYLWWLLAK